jgi:hypothetical protein
MRLKLSSCYVIIYIKTPLPYSTIHGLSGANPHTCAHLMCYRQWMRTNAGSVVGKKTNPSRYRSQRARYRVQIHPSALLTSLLACARVPNETCWACDDKCAHTVPWCLLLTTSDPCSSEKGTQGILAMLSARTETEFETPAPHTQARLRQKCGQKIPSCAQ